MQPIPDNSGHVDQSDLIRRAKESLEQIPDDGQLMALVKLLGAVERFSAKERTCPLCGFTGECSDHCPRNLAADAILESALTARARSKLLRRLAQSARNQGQN
jgi:hypothetical protein